MSDSLREQMLKAGFKDTAAPKKKARRPANSKQAKRSAHQIKHQSGQTPTGHTATGPSSMERENIAKREAVAERKRIKAEIKSIIEAEKVEDVKVEAGKVDSNKADVKKAGANKKEAPKSETEKATADKVDHNTGKSSHSYVMGKRIKQMFVSDAIREQLVDGSLVITRLNGATYLIPAQTGQKIQALNPEWVVITPSSDTSVDADDEYADYQVPDDLKW